MRQKPMKTAEIDKKKQFWWIILGSKKLSVLHTNFNWGQTKISMTSLKRFLPERVRGVYYFIKILKTGDRVVGWQNSQPTSEVENAQPPWLQRVHRDLKRATIRLAEVWERTQFRAKVPGVKNVPKNVFKFWPKNGWKGQTYENSLPGKEAAKEKYREDDWKVVVS